MKLDSRSEQHLLYSLVTDFFFMFLNDFFLFIYSSHFYILFFFQISVQYLKFYPGVPFDVLFPSDEKKNI